MKIFQRKKTQDSGERELTEEHGAHYSAHIYICIGGEGGQVKGLHCRQLCPLAALICFLLKLMHLKHWE